MQRKGASFFELLGQSMETETATIVGIGYQPPSKTPPSLSCQAIPLNLQTIQVPLFRQSPLCIGFSRTPTLKNEFFSEGLKDFLRIKVFHS